MDSDENDDIDLTFESFITASEVRKILNVQIFEPESGDEEDE